MQKVWLRPNAKDINGIPLKLDFFNKDSYILKKKRRTYVISNGIIKAEVYHDQVKILE